MMERNKLREKLKDKSSFVVYVELTGGPKLSFGPIENFLKAYKAVDGLVRPDSLKFAGLSVINSKSVV